MGTKFTKQGKKNRRAGKFTAFLLAGVMTAALTGSGNYAAGNVDYDSLIANKEAEIEQLQKDNEQRKQQIQSFTGNIADNEEMMNTITDQINGIDSQIRKSGELITLKQEEITNKQLEIDRVSKSIADKEMDIARKKVEIENLEEENKKNLEKFKKLCNALYKSSDMSALPLLNGSEDWYNFFVYNDVINSISKQTLDFMNRLLDDIREQKNKIEELNSEIERLEQDKLNLKDEKTALEEKMTELEAAKAALEADKEQQYADLYNLAASNQILKDKVSGLKTKVNATNAEIEQANKDVEEIIRQKQAANSGQTIYSSSGFRWPLSRDYQRITTYFGYDAWRGGNHYGIDIAQAGIGGQPIYAAQSGTVITAYNDSLWHGGYGNYVVIDHGGSLSTLYAHCVSTVVKEGQFVNKGDVIGYVGTTGWSTGNHLHFETRVNGKAVNPFNYEYEYVY
ncbi:MAG: murein hydrolase activator EnvC family protein [Oscillospiraceae bacterium]